jgi:hypothetical protein
LSRAAKRYPVPRLCLRPRSRMSHYSSKLTLLTPQRPMQPMRRSGRHRKARAPLAHQHRTRPTRSRHRHRSHAMMHATSSAAGSQPRHPRSSRRLRDQRQQHRQQQRNGEYSPHLSKSVAQPSQPPKVQHSPARMILPYRMSFHVSAIEVHVPQIPRAIPLRLVIKVR